MWKNYVSHPCFSVLFNLLIYLFFVIHYIINLHKWTYFKWIMTSRLQIAIFAGMNLKFLWNNSIQKKRMAICHIALLHVLNKENYIWYFLFFLLIIPAFQLLYLLCCCYMHFLQNILYNNTNIGIQQNFLLSKIFNLNDYYIFVN